MLFKTTQGGINKRYIITFFGTTLTALGCILRYCIGIALTEMVVMHRSENTTTFHTTESCPIPGDTEDVTTKNQNNGEFNWSDQSQGIIMSALFWTYSTLQIPMGLIAHRFDTKHVMAAGVFLSGISTLLIPLVSRLIGASGVVVLRILLGIGQASLYPSLSVLLSAWIPPQERSQLGAIIMVGENIGNMLSMAASGVILASGRGSWPYVFYLFGGLSMLWLLSWLIFGYSSPEIHPSITENEKKYLKESIAVTYEKTKTPWKEIALSLPVWANLLAQLGHEWGLITTITYLPRYMKSVLHFDIQKNGFLSALPFLVMTIVGVTAGHITDYAMAKNFLSVTASRKLFTAIANIGPALGLLGASYAGCNRGLVVTMFATGMGCMGFFYPSLAVNPLDLSPNYSGQLTGIVGCGTLVGIVAPYLVAMLTPQQTVQQWRGVFEITASVMISTALFYVLFGSGKVQRWNSKLTLKKKPDDGNS